MKVFFHFKYAKFFPKEHPVYIDYVVKKNRPPFVSELATQEDVPPGKKSSPATGGDANVASVARAADSLLVCVFYLYFFILFLFNFSHSTLFPFSNRMMKVILCNIFLTGYELRIVKHLRKKELE